MTVLLVDDHLLFSQSLASLLTQIEQVDTIRVSASGQDALHYLAQNPTDLVLTDWQMPDMSGLVLTTRIHEQFPRVKVLVISMLSDPDTIRQAFSAGASGYLTKTTDLTELRKALAQIIDGETYLNSTLMRKLMEPTVQPSRVKSDSVEPLTSLTPRETDVLRLIAAECNTNEIAERLFLSPGTVEVHRRNLLRKLNAKNMVGLIKYALRAGLLD